MIFKDEKFRRFFTLLFLHFQILNLLRSSMNILLSNFETITGMPDIFGYIFVFIFGAIVGSFLNVVIHRVPLEESIVFPNSACPNCKKAIKPYDNLPILSWLILGGKCRSCKAKISPRYLGVELLTALLFTLTFWAIGFTAFLPVALVFVATIVSLIFIDAENMILPDVINYPLLGLALLVRVLYPLFIGADYFADLRYAPLSLLHNQPVWLVSLLGAMLGALAGGGSLWLVGEIWKRLRKVEAMGLGDVKMMFAVGALLGWRLTVLTIFLGAFSGAVVGVFLVFKDKNKDMQTQIPFGIFLGIGSILALLFGEQMIGWYIRTFIP
jgi:leader peptidase (prepilin peptidase)/N-methyltransferase